MKLKTCPHCGGTAWLNCNYSHRIKIYFVYVRCDICGAQGKAFTSYEDPAAAGWNTTACKDAATAWNMRTNKRGTHEK